MSEEKNFNIKAFLLSFFYYLTHGNKIFGMVGFIVCLVLPLNTFYVVSLIESLVYWRLDCCGKVKCVKDKHYIVLGCIWVFLFFGMKLMLERLYMLYL